MYYIGVAIMEEIYLRGLLQNIIEMDVRLSIMVNLLSRSFIELFNAVILPQQHTQFH